MKLGSHFSLVAIDSKNNGSKTQIDSFDAKSNVEYVHKNSIFEATLLSEKMAKN